MLEWGNEGPIQGGYCTEYGAKPDQEAPGAASHQEQPALQVHVTVCRSGAARLRWPLPGAAAPSCTLTWHGRQAWVHDDAQPL